MHFRVALIVGLVLGVLTGALSFCRFDLVERGEAWFYDTWVRDAVSEIRTEADIVIVQISDRDLELVDEHAQLTWPWPRELQGQLIEYVASAGAKSIMVDLIYQDRGAESDMQALVEVLRKSPVAVGIVTPPRSGSIKKAAADGTWVAPLDVRPSWLEAVGAAVRLMSYNQRVFVSEEAQGRFQIFTGGARSQEDLVAEWQRLAAEPALNDLFAKKPPAPRLVGTALAASEVSADEIVRRRFGLPIPGIDRWPAHELLAPHEQIAEAAVALGSVTQDADPDGMLRHYRYVVRHRGIGLPSLALAGFLAAHPKARLSIDEERLRIDDREIPTTPEGQTLLRFGSTKHFRRVSAYDVLVSSQELSEEKTPRIHPKTFEGKYVLVIPTATALRDDQATPLSRASAGGEIQAEALANLLVGRFVRRAPRWLEALSACLFVTLTALIVMVVAHRVRRAWWGASAAALAGIGCIVVYYMVGSRIYHSFDLWVAVCAPGFGGVLAAVDGLVFSTMAERGERRFVQEALGRYTSRELVDELMSHPEKLSLNYGERRTVSVYFSDIAGFTSISEGMEPEQLVLLLNEYLTAMTEIVLEHGGVVDKYIGDAVMAFWGAPLEDRAHGYHAVAAALKMKRACDRLRTDWRGRFGHDVMARAGVNSGIAVAGNMGSTHKYNYTLMGDTVNLASRLEGANKAYGTDIMISEYTQKEVADRFLLRELDALAVKGKTRPVRVFEVLCTIEEQTAADTELVSRFDQGLRTYRERDFKGARSWFEKTLEIRPNDNPARVFLERCEILSDNPPEGDWDSVWRMKEK